MKHFQIIFQVAHKTRNPRLRFIFYYQVIEYCSYYYLDQDLKNSNFKILKDPAISNEPDRFSRVIIESFKDHFQHRDDRAKIEKTISAYCTIENVEKEIKANYEYFSQPIIFDGGLKISRFIKDKKAADKLIEVNLKNIADNIVDIRNVLVHLRESSENEVILPTSRNNHLLKPYLHIVRRLAENVAIRFN